MQNVFTALKNLTNLVFNLLSEPSERLARRRTNLYINIGIPL